MADYQDRNNTPQAARVTGERDVIIAPNYMRWLAEGKIFEAGFGGEDVDDEENSQASLADITATFALQSPTADEPIVVPILLKLMMSGDGNALTNFQVAFTKPAALCGTALTLSGTALTSKHSLYRTSPPQTAQQATALFGDAITVSVLIASDYISYHLGHVIDAVLTSGLVALGDGPSNVHAFRFLKEGLPHLLTQGAAMLVYLYGGATDSVVAAYMQWAEVTKNDMF